MEVYLVTLTNFVARFAFFEAKKKKSFSVIFQCLTIQFLVARPKYSIELISLLMTEQHVH